ncbi:MAG TPA: YncE family protein [Thermoplasmata archaeon]|nr:YncE family protein [Thermoplasmata archaeon]
MARTSAPTWTPRSARVSVALFAVAVLLLSSSLLAVGASRESPATPRGDHAGEAAIGTEPRAPGPPGARPAGGIGTVVSTLDLATNELQPGAYSFGVQNQPLDLVYDLPSNSLFVRGNLGNDLSVVNLTTGLDVRDIPVPYSQHSLLNVQSLLTDPGTGRLYAANANAGNVSVVSGSTDAVVASVAVGGSPYGLALDPATRTIFVSDYGASNVTAFSSQSLRTVANVTVGTAPGPILFDPASDQVFVANSGTANVSVLNASTRTLVATLAVRAHPEALALDTVNDRVDVLSQNAGSAAVTVLNAGNDTVRATVVVGGAAGDLLFVPSLDRLFVAVSSAGNVTVVSPLTDRIVGSAGTGTGAELGALSYSGTDGDLYVACPGSGNLTVVDPAIDRSVANLSLTDFPLVTFADDAAHTVYVLGEGTSLIAPALDRVSESAHAGLGSIPLGTGPSGIVYDNSSGLLFVANAPGDGIYAVSGTNGSVARLLRGAPGPTPLLDPLAFDSSTGALYAANPANNSVVDFNYSAGPIVQVPVGLDPVGISAAQGRVFSANDINGNVSVVSEATHRTTGSFNITAYHNVRAVFADPDNGLVYVADWSDDEVIAFGAANLTQVAAVHVGSGPSSFAYDPLNHTLFVANSGSGNVSVLSTLTNALVTTFSLAGASQLAYDSALDAVYNAMSISADVGAVSAATYAPLAGTPLVLGAGELASGIAYDPANAEVFVTSSVGGTVSVIGTETTYPVLFEQTGLPVNTSWGVSFAGTPVTTNSTSIRYEVPNGHYAFNVFAVPGYLPNVTGGFVNVTGAARTVEIYFAQVSVGAPYPIDFIENGLPPTHNSWSVRLRPMIPGANYTTFATVGGSIVFNRPNGSYEFQVPNSWGYLPAPSSGPVLVNGSSVNISITFTPGVTALVVTVAALPVTFNLGQGTNLTGTESGGLPPYSLVYVNLPLGCTSQSRNVLPCTPTVAGSFTVKLVATDSNGTVASASTTFEVLNTTSKSPNGPGGSSSSGPYLYVGLLALVIALVLLAVLLRRRRREPPAPGSTAGPPATPAAAPEVAPPSGPPPPGGALGP